MAEKSFKVKNSLVVKDVEIDPSGATSSQVLAYDGSKFTPSTPLTLSSSNPQDLGSVSAGVSTSASRSDHVHPTTGLAVLGSTNAFTVGGHTITNAAAGTVPLTITAASGQTANVQEWKNNAGNLIGVLSNIGAFTAINPTASNNARASTLVSTAGLSGASTSVYMGVYPSATASSRYGWIEAGDAGGNRNVIINPNLGGRLGVAETSPSATFHVTALPGGGTIGAIVKANSSQSVSIQEWRSSNDTVLARINQQGFLGVGGIPNGVIYGTANALADTVQTNRSTSSTTGVFTSLRVRSTTSGDMTNGFGTALVFQIMDNANIEQSSAAICAIREANSDIKGALLFQINNSFGLIEKARLGSDGAFLVNSTSSSMGSSGTGAQFGVISDGPGYVPIVSRAAVAQTANLHEWQDSGGNVLAKIDSVGNAQFVSIDGGSA